MVDVSGIKTNKFVAPNLPFGDYIGLKPIAIAEESLQAPASDSPHNILNILCDDILRIIFKDPSMNSMQLLAISNVCVRFKDIAVKIGTKRHTGELMLHNKIPYCGSLWLLDEYLRMYGRSITKIEYYHTGLNVDITLALLSKYCKNVVAIKGNFWNSLQSMCASHVFLNDFHGFNVPTLVPSNSPEVQSFQWLLKVQRLSEGILTPAGSLGDVSFFRQMQHLKSLHLIDTPIYATVPILNAIADGNVELQTLELEEVCTVYGLLYPRFKPLRSLKTLILSPIDRHNLNKIVTELVGGDDAQLETLKLYNCREFINDFAFLGRLKNLKSLILSQICKINTNLILRVLAASNVRLERLELIDVRENSFVHFITQMTSIKYLRVNAINDVRLLAIVHKMEHIIEITTNSKDISFKGIRNALEKSKNLTKVRIQEITPGLESIDINDLKAIDGLLKARSIDLMVDMGPIQLRREVCSYGTFCVSAN